mmetsp:Transcript_29353/g.84935  ORF Transcript_29353/g.84935 Transcript_29353/m.84935 type:complete len:273 (+) Transcript_29353:4710-5528(+)
MHTSVPCSTFIMIHKPKHSTRQDKTTQHSTAQHPDDPFVLKARPHTSTSPTHEKDLAVIAQMCHAQVWTPQPTAVPNHRPQAAREMWPYQQTKNATSLLPLRHDCLLPTSSLRRRVRLVASPLPPRTGMGSGVSLNVSQILPSTVRMLASDIEKPSLAKTWVNVATTPLLSGPLTVHLTDLPPSSTCTSKSTPSSCSTGSPSPPSSSPVVGGTSPLSVKAVACCTSSGWGWPLALVASLLLSCWPLADGGGEGEGAGAAAGDCGGGDEGVAS